MADKPTTDVKKEKFLQAYKNSLGIVSGACEMAGVSRMTYNRWIKADEDFAAKIKDMADFQCDFVESKLLKKIEEGDTTAIIFYLKTKGKKRGYTTNPEKDSAIKLLESFEKKDPKKIELRLKRTRAKIINMLKEDNRYHVSLQCQVDIVASASVKISEIRDIMATQDYKPLLTQISREGDVRYNINPLEPLYQSYMSKYQSGLKALGMNYDAKDIKPDEQDQLADLIKSMNED